MIAPEAAFDIRPKRRSVIPSSPFASLELCDHSTVRFPLRRNGPAESNIPTHDKVKYTSIA